jgi:metal-responsive CopG/Arc/MetJ family transcriptional regulator
MSTIQVVLDEDLLRAADQAAEQVGVNRSALIRDALREYLRRLLARRLEEIDRAGYERHPDSSEDLAVWEGVAAWPED